MEDCTGRSSGACSHVLGLWSQVSACPLSNHSDMYMYLEGGRRREKNEARIGSVDIDLGSLLRKEPTHSILLRHQSTIAPS